MSEIKARRGRWALVLVLLLVNGAAVWGQAGWALEHIVPAEWTPGTWAPLALALAFAMAIELIGVFLALSADDAEDRGIPSGGIRLSSYGIGIVSGALNFSHWSGAAAIAFALLSAISPFLWGINSRVNRARPIAPSRRFWHPRRSVGLIRHMAWEGIALEAEGISSLAERAALVGGWAEQDTAEIMQSDDTSPREIEASSTLASLARNGTGLKPRTPRGTVSEAMRDAAMAVLDGMSVKEAAAKFDVPQSSLGRINTLRNALVFATPEQYDSVCSASKLRPSLIELVRDHVTITKVKGAEQS